MGALRNGWGAAAAVIAIACGGSETPGLGVGTTGQPATPAWATVGELPAQVERHTVTLLPSGNVLIVGGLTHAGPSADVRLYDGVNSEVRSIAALGTARAGHTATLLEDGRVLIVGGTDGTQALVSAELFDPGTQTLSIAGDLTEPRLDHVATRLASGEVLVTGGGTATAELFDPTSEQFRPTGSMTLPRSGHTATRLPDGHVLIPDFGASEAFDPAADGGLGAFVPTGGMQVVDPVAATATLLPDGRVLVVGGCGVPPGPATECGELVQGDSLSFTSAELAEIYDPTTGTFRRVADDTVLMRQDHSANLMPTGRVVLAGGGPAAADGFGATTRSVSTARVERFEPATELFAATASMVLPRRGHGSAVLADGSLLMVGRVEPELIEESLERYTEPGDFAPGPSLSLAHVDPLLTLLRSGQVLVVSAAGAERFDPVLERFEPAGAPGLAGVETATLVADGSVVLIGGDAVERYAPSASGGVGTFVPAGVLTQARPGHTATLLPDRTVLIVGGGDSETVAQTAEIYDPATERSTLLASELTAPRSAHAAVRLTTGQVLIVGGTSAELYDPTPRTFTPTGAPSGVHSAPLAFLLTDGRVLVVSYESRVAELYDPASGTFSPTPELTTPYREGAAGAVLQSGHVLHAGGAAHLMAGSNAAELFLSTGGRARGAFVPAGALGTMRVRHGMVALADGRALVVGGLESLGVPDSPSRRTSELYSTGVVAARRPVLEVVPTRATGGDQVELAGTGFAPALDASGSTRSAASGNVPVVVWIPESGQGRVVGGTTAFTDTTARWTAPATALHGHGRLHVVVNGVASVGVPLELLPGASGAACAQAAACASGFCADGVCCDTPCTGSCEACSAARKGSGADGLCGPVPPELAPDDECVLVEGQRCTSASQCLEGFCADGYCCDRPCAGQCEACDVEGSVGQCVAVTGAPHGGSRASCAAGTAEAPCGARICDGADRARCAGWVGGEVECAPGACRAGVATPAATCDGRGTCASPEAHSCAPAGCAGVTCGDGICTTEEDCHPDYRCAKGLGAELGTCVLATTRCDGEHTLLEPSGAERDCAPYACTGEGTCLTSCGSATDCVRGSACSAQGQCVPDEGVGAALGGCTCTSTPHPGGTAPTSLIGLALLAFTYRRTGRRRS